jgi:hypothetical protein
VTDVNAEGQSLSDDDHDSNDDCKEEQMEEPDNVNIRATVQHLKGLHHHFW